MARKIMCSNNHRMVPIVPELWLCQCSSYGRLAGLKGCVAEAREIVNQAGGINLILDLIETIEAAARNERKAARAQAQANARKPRPDAA